MSPEWVFSLLSKVPYESWLQPNHTREDLLLQFYCVLKPTGVIRGVLGNVVYIYYHKLAELSFGVK